MDQQQARAAAQVQALEQAFIDAGVVHCARHGRVRPDVMLSAVASHFASVVIAIAEVDGDEAYDVADRLISLLRQQLAEVRETGACQPAFEVVITGRRN